MGVSGPGDSTGGIIVATTIEEAFDQALAELDFDLGDNSDDILTEPADNDTKPEAGDEPEGEDSDQEDQTEEEPEPDDSEVDPNAPVFEVPKNGVLVLPDGTRVDAEKAVLLQADYTRKTQELAEQRKEFENEKSQLSELQSEVVNSYQQMRGWYEERVVNPTGWIQEIVASTPQPTATIAKALYDLAHAGVLEPEFVETFGIDSGEVAEKANTVRSQTELEQLRARLDEREYAEAQQFAVQRQAQVYQSQWDNIKGSHGLEFDGADAEMEAKRELLQFAMESRLTRSLEDAYDLMSVRKGKTVAPKPDPEPTPDPEVTAKKRASRAVSRKSVSSSAGSTPKKALSTRDAALAALDEFATRA